jgi:hypothetical protein
MNKKSKKTQRKQIIEQTPPLYLSEGHWEEAMLENNSYYDIDLLHKHNKPIYKRIEKWEKKYDEASSWLGKWYCQIRIDKERAKLKHYENKS